MVFLSIWTESKHCNAAKSIKNKRFYVCPCETFLTLIHLKNATVEILFQAHSMQQWTLKHSVNSSHSQHCREKQMLNISVQYNHTRIPMPKNMVTGSKNIIKKKLTSFWISFVWLTIRMMRHRHLLAICWSFDENIHFLVPMEIFHFLYCFSKIIEQLSSINCAIPKNCAQFELWEMAIK